LPGGMSMSNAEIYSLSYGLRELRTLDYLIWKEYSVKIKYINMEDVKNEKIAWQQS
jgi:hypothetical protein